jgi:hypothetical protein
MEDTHICLKHNNNNNNIISLCFLNVNGICTVIDVYNKNNYDLVKNKILVSTYVYICMYVCMCVCARARACVVNKCYTNESALGINSLM